MSEKEKHRFRESEKLGKIGEELVRKYLISQGYEVKDVRDDWTYRDKDIDFIIKRNGIERTVEAKCDKRTEFTGNIFFETISNQEAKTQGCMIKTKADYICYVLRHKGTAIVMKTEEYKKWFNENKGKFQGSPVANEGTEGRKDFNGYGYIIPLSRKLSRFKGPTIYEDMPRDIFKLVKLPAE